MASFSWGRRSVNLCSYMLYIYYLGKDRKRVLKKKKQKPKHPFTVTRGDTEKTLCCFFLTVKQESILWNKQHDISDCPIIIFFKADNSWGGAERPKSGRGQLQPFHSYHSVSLDWGPHHSCYLHWEEITGGNFPLDANRSCSGVCPWQRQRVESFPHAAISNRGWRTAAIYLNK